jgi:peroxiredoxin
VSLPVLFALVPWVVVAAGGWVAYRLLVQNGRIIQSLDGIDGAMAELVGGTSQPVDEGLGAGVQAPSFELPALEGDPVSLEQFKGKRVLLVFFSTSCVYCELAAPKLAKLPVSGADGRPVPLIVSSATADEMRATVAKHGLGCPVLLQKGAGVSNAYKTTSTPSGYLIDEEGILISDLVVGTEELLEMATNPKSPLIKTGRNVAFLGMPKALGS